MPIPVSLRLDEDDQATLESAAKQRGVGLSTDLRHLTSDEAKRLRRERIRQQSLVVGHYGAASAEAQEFYADGGLSAPNLGS